MLPCLNHTGSGWEGGKGVWWGDQDMMCVCSSS